MSATTPRVWVLAWEDRAYIDGPQPGDARVWLDTPAWAAWLARLPRGAYCCAMAAVVCPAAEPHCEAGLLWAEAATVVISNASEKAIEAGRMARIRSGDRNVMRRVSVAVSRSGRGNSSPQWGGLGGSSLPDPSAPG